MDQQQFAALVRHIGLTPEDHDVEDLRKAYLRLQDLLRLLDPGPAEADSLAVFDPGKPL